MASRERSRGRGKRFGASSRRTAQPAERRPTCRLQQCAAGDQAPVQPAIGPHRRFEHRWQILRRRVTDRSHRSETDTGSLKQPRRLPGLHIHCGQRHASRPTPKRRLLFGSDHEAGHGDQPAEDAAPSRKLGGQVRIQVKTGGAVLCHDALGRHQVADRKIGRQGAGDTDPHRLPTRVARRQTDTPVGRRSGTARADAGYGDHHVGAANTPHHSGRSPRPGNAARVLEASEQGRNLEPHRSEVDGSGAGTGTSHGRHGRPGHAAQCDPSPVADLVTASARTRSPRTIRPPAPAR